MKADKHVEILLTQGWAIDEETKKEYVLSKNVSTIGGTLLVFLLTVWWSFGIGNIIYYSMCSKTQRIRK